MKRYLVLIALTLMAASCQRGEFTSSADIVGGRTAINNKEAHNYMMHIADNLVTDLLDELELGLSISARGVQSSAHFTFDKRLVTVGSTWTVKADDSHLNGLIIRCTAEDTWTLDFTGDYVFGNEENDYPTSISLKAVRYVPADEEDTTLGWEVTFSGERKEWKEDKKQKSNASYSCTFRTGPGPAPLRYLNTRGKGATGWNQLFGDVYMDVYKAGEKIDVCCLSFEGSPSQATFIRGL